METITIPYEDYKELLEESNMYKDMNRELQFILRTCDWNDYRECLNLDEQMQNFMEKYIPNDLNKRIKKFMEEEKNNNE